MGTPGTTGHRELWNKGKIVGQKAPFKLKDIWALRVRLQMESRVRELALFNLGIDSKLRACYSRRGAGVDLARRAEAGRLPVPEPSAQFAASGHSPVRRILGGWVGELGLDPADYGTHSMRRTKAALICRRTKNLRAVQLLLGHSKLESTVRYREVEPGGSRKRRPPKRARLGARRPRPAVG